MTIAESLATGGLQLHSCPPDLLTMSVPVGWSWGDSKSGADCPGTFGTL
jgi:hypothetical protein